MNPKDRKTWNNKGIVLGELGRYDEALGCFEKVLEINPEDHRAWYMKGEVLEKLGRCEEALESYRKALKLKPEYNEAKKALKKLEKKQ
ncbi:hypothetical protein DNK57_02015 [Methanothermobacter thermautotrophicus]|uniref:Tetratricopeptide repeat protein n=1 Tax=Methanothermobacter thermautotrophicus TaxID=145262 RepID=A0A842YJS6_METTF|nr:tetratricopeptide repeat protein [Methanothermobacter thermautotrophicus]MBE2899606.1 hypothetical protein [Methanothermobacter thermautotrophicus]